MVVAGIIVAGQCDCGYSSSKMFIFGGMKNFKTYCAFPALCKDCHKVVMINLMDSPFRCKICQGTKVIPYNDQRLYKKLGDRMIATWNTSGRVKPEPFLTNGDYLCPVCNKYNLHFSDAGRWD